MRYTLIGGTLIASVDRFHYFMQSTLVGRLPHILLNNYFMNVGVQRYVSATSLCLQFYRKYLTALENNIKIFAANRTSTITVIPNRKVYEHFGCHFIHYNLLIIIFGKFISMGDLNDTTHAF